MKTETAWVKCPSVRPGGKAHFLYNPKKRLWIVWDRISRAWVLKTASQTLGKFITENAARAAIAEFRNQP